VVTHDGTFYGRLCRSHQRAVLLRVKESQARQRLKETLPTVISALNTGPCGVRVLKDDVVIDRFEKAK
jgi:hypothetical protein